MSFVQNRLEEQQLSLFGPLNTLTKREKTGHRRNILQNLFFPRLMKSRMLSYTAIRIHAQTRLLMSRSVRC